MNVYKNIYFTIHIRHLLDSIALKLHRTPKLYNNYTEIVILVSYFTYSIILLPL